jgi:hypothetical protein
MKVVETQMPRAIAPISSAVSTGLRARLFVAILTL